MSFLQGRRQHEWFALVGQIAQAVLHPQDGKGGQVGAEPFRGSAGKFGADGAAPSGNQAIGGGAALLAGHILQPAWKSAAGFRNLLQGFYVGSQLASLGGADALVSEGMHGFLLRSAVLNEIGQIGIRSLLHCRG